MGWLLGTRGEDWEMSESWVLGSKSTAVWKDTQGRQESLPSGPLKLSARVQTATRKGLLLGPREGLKP